VADGSPSMTGKRVRSLRLHLGLSKSKIAWLLQTGESSIAAVERGSRTVPNRWVPWLIAMERAGPRAIRKLKPCFPSRYPGLEHAGNLIAAWRIILELA